MEWERNPRRAQSLMSIPSSYDQPTWTDAGLRDKKTSVSQLVARYQTTVEVGASGQDVLANNGKAKPKQVLEEITPSLLESKESLPEVLLWRHEERRRSRAKASSAHIESIGSPPNSARSIDALKSQFESKAATQNKAKSLFRATGFTPLYKAADFMPVMNGEIKEVKSPAEKQETQISAGPVKDATEDHVTRKVVNRTRMERRKTIGGVDFENIAASQADQKRRSIADFRDSSFIETKEKLSVSVKAMSALYLSKVAPQGSRHSLLNPAQDQSSESGKRLKTTKMAEDFQKRKDDVPPLPLTRHQPGSEDFSGVHFQQSMPSQLSKEKLYQQRQKCELRRLLKHTHPELKMLDDVVDEELAEVLSSETGVTTGETGYEGEVLSRRLIFENCALSDKVSPYTPKRHMAEGTVEKGDVSKKSAVFEEHEERLCSKSVTGIMKDDEMLGSSPDPNTEEEMIRIDVQATRRIFENQSVNTSRLYLDNKFQGKVATSGDETGAIQKHKQEYRKEGTHSENQSIVCTKSLDLTDQPHKQELTMASTDHRFADREEFSPNETIFEDEDEPASLPDPQNFGEIIKTSATLFKNNPFIQTNIEKENSFVHTSKPQSPVEHSGEAQDYPIDNVKNRAHLFESMPFNKIRHQNKEEVETMVENIKGTLNSLYQVNAIHSGGSIIEVNETMIAKKAKFALSEAGPEIKYDEVAEGGAQNFILQLLPRTNLKPQIIYLKEDSKGTMEAAMVNVPVHHHQFATNQDTEFKTANVVQVVEDILNQDNSLRKGVIIQEDVDRCVEVIVYSLYNYFDEEDVKSYCPPQGAKYDEPEPEKVDMSKTENQGLRRGAIESTISCLLETSKVQTSQGSVRPEITEKGNVKLFKCCIEKGDLEYLKSLQTDSTEQEQELLPNQNVAGQGMKLQYTQTGDQAEESASEFVPVDIKKLKNMFSGDQIPTQAKQDVCENLARSTTISSFAGQNVALGKSQPSAKCNVGVFSHVQLKNTFRECGTQNHEEEACNTTVAPQGSYLHLETQDDGRVHKAELVELVDDNDEIDNLQTAIHNLQQATIEAKSLHHSSQEKQKFFAQESSKKPLASVAVGNVKHSRTDAELLQENEVQKEDSCIIQPRWDEFSSASNITSDCQSENTEKCYKDSLEVQTTETCSKIGHKGTEDVQKPALVSVHSSETTATQQEDDEVVLQGKLQAALNSLEKSNINVSRGDFRAAMIYKNSSKPSKQRSQNMDAVSNQMHTKEEFCLVTEPKSTQAPLRQEVSKEQVISAKAELPSHSKILNKPAESAVLETSKQPVGPKPAIPPKPEHLKVKQRDIQSTTAKNLEATQTNPVRPKETVAQPLPMTSLSCEDEHKHDMFKIKGGANTGPDLQTDKLFNETIPMSREIEVRHQVQGSVVTLESDYTDKNPINQQQEMNAPLEEKKTQTSPIKDDMNETDESHVDFQGARKKFEGKNAFSVKNAPVKPKRVKIAQSDKKNPKGMSGDNNSSLQQTPTGPSFSTPNTFGQTPDTKDKYEKDIKQESKVEMREKKGRTETEDERRQRLSVHMDEIMRENITAAMEIFDNLRKQEELQSILSRVEEIEEDTREVDVRSLRGVFENVPDWVVCSDKKKQKKAEVENKDQRMLTTGHTESKSSVAHVFGDLERASEEIIHLKEQTLSRLMDIEDAIKKALCSVSTLKSDSDIVGLSCLFKESLGTGQGSPSSGNISKISIGSSRTKTVPTQESPTALPVSQSANIEAGSAKRRASPPSSPAFISIQSAARKSGKTEVLPSETTICPTCQHSPKTEEKFRTTKTLTCNSPAQNRKKDPRKGGQKQSSYKPSNPNRELSVLEVQTDPEVNNMMGTKTVTENYERTDNLGNRFYSSKTSTLLTAQPETTTSTGHAGVSPATYQVTKHPEVWLPINQKP